MGGARSPLLRSELARSPGLHSHVVAHKPVILAEVGVAHSRHGHELGLEGSLLRRWSPRPAVSQEHSQDASRSLGARAAWAPLQNGGDSPGRRPGSPPATVSPGPGRQASWWGKGGKVESPAAPLDGIKCQGRAALAQKVQLGGRRTRDPLGVPPHLPPQSCRAFCPVPPTPMPSTHLEELVDHRRKGARQLQAPVTPACFGGTGLAAAETLTVETEESCLGLPRRSA